MKRLFTIAAAAALLVGVSVPAAAISKPDSSAASSMTTPGAPAGDAQGLQVSVAAAALDERDGYAAEPKPAPVVEASYAYGSYSGPVPDAFVGMFSVWPVPGGRLADGFGYRDGGEFHSGIDVLAPGGTPIFAVGAGTVVQIGFDGGWGQYVRIAHNGSVHTLYAHMIGGSPTVGVGQFVEAGQVIGYVGATGYATTTHCHLEVWLDGSRVDPLQFFA